jgi:prepilin-type N-terminal cleavage/methylation domain-containing protein
MKRTRLLKSDRGFTLLEFVVVMALAALVMVAATILVGKGRESSQVSATSDRLRVITTGLTEYKMVKNGLPAQGSSSTTWPNTLSAYIPDTLRAGGTFPFGYQCAGSTVTIRTPAFDSTTEAQNIATKLANQGVCATATANGSAIDCALADFNNNTTCQ